MHMLVLLCINQQTKFEVPSFTISKDMIGQNFNKLAPCGTGGRLLLKVTANFKVTWHKN